MSGNPSNDDTSSPDPANKKREQEEDLWIEFYYGLLLAIASLPAELIVLQNLVEAHERFSRFFRPTHVISFDDFKTRCDTMVPRIMAKLRERLSHRIQEGGYPIVLATSMTFTEERLRVYREEREKLIDDDIRDIDPEGYTELWRRLTEFAEKQFSYSVEDTGKAVVEDNVSPLTTTATTPNIASSTPVAPIAPANASVQSPSATHGVVQPLQKFWTNDEIAYLEFFFIQLRNSTFLGRELKMPTSIEICNHFNAFLRARDANFVERNVNQVARYCGRKGTQVYQCRRDAERLLKVDGDTYIPQFTNAEFDQHLSMR